LKKRRREKILVVEDDKSLRDGLVMNLELEGYQVESASEGEEGLRKAFDSRPDLIILDIMMPAVSGLEILDELRSRHEDVRVLILSARNTTDNRIEGLKLGADDYVTKPFELPELLARVEAMLRRRRMDDEAEPDIVCGKLLIHPAARKVSLSGSAVDLTAKEFDLLLLLARHRGQAFTRDVILEKVWGWGYEGTDRTVDNVVVSLRKKIEADPSAPLYVQTVRQVGYRFSGEDSP
jgi:DNA-binding response OmpR family regulator